MKQQSPSGFARARRWLVPAAAVAAIAAGVTVNQASAEPPLPAKTAEQLLTDLQQPTLDAFSGTVTSTVDLGLPALPVGEDATQLLSGTHTVRVWADGSSSKVAIADGTDEWATIRDGRTVWTWSSSERKATKTTVAAGQRQAPRELPSSMPKTPQEAAARALTAIEPGTEVSTSRTTTVAGRSAYELVLKPTSPGTLVEEVSISVDAVTNMALRVQTWAVGVDEPVIDIGYTSFSDTAPDASVFEFTPPPGVTVTEKTVTPGQGGKKDGERPNIERPQVVGTGWSTVVIASIPEGAVAKAGGSSESAQWEQALKQLPTVSGSWGSGKLLQSSLFSVVITDDDRIVVGAVDSDTLVGAIR